MRLEDIAVVVLTCRRSPPVLSQTLASLLLGAWGTVKDFQNITVLVDDQGIETAGELHRHTGVRWVFQTDEERARAEAMPLHQRACYAYCGGHFGALWKARAHRRQAC